MRWVDLLDGGESTVQDSRTPEEIKAAILEHAGLREEEG